MKKQLLATSLVCLLSSMSALSQAESDKTLVYINENLGFNVPGYNYKQSNFPCDIDKHLVEELVKQGKRSKLKMEPVRTAEKIRNGTVPVLAMDVEQLVLGSEEHTYGTESDSHLPKVQITAAIIKGDDMTTAKHTCAIATLNEFTPASNILDLGTTVTVCSATRKCLRDLSKDVVDWVAPQVK